MESRNQAIKKEIKEMKELQHKAAAGATIHRPRYYQTWTPNYSSAKSTKAFILQ